MSASEAFNILKEQIHKDKALAFSWHSSVAMMCHDAILDFDDQVDFAHEVGNDAAKRFMKLFFDVDTSELP